MSWFIGFALLTIVPGFIIFDISRINRIGLIERILYIVGLSLVFDIVAGVIANFLLPRLNIDKPFSSLPMNLFFVGITIILCLIRFRKSSGFHVFDCTIPQWKSVRYALFIAILTIVTTIIGARFDVHWIPYLFPIIFIGVIIFGLIKKDVYSCAIIIFALSLSLLLQTTLISNYLTGSDIIIEHLFHKYTLLNGVWNASSPNIYASALSVTILSPMYALIMDLDGIWIFKIIFPIIFSLTPVALFIAYRRFFGIRLSFLSVIFLLITPIFSLEMISVVKQQIAFFALSLVLLTIFNRNIGIRTKTIFVIVFTMLTMVAHYGVGVILVALLISTLLMLIVFKGLRIKIHNIFPIKYMVVSILSIVILGIGFFQFTSSGSLISSIKTMVVGQTEQIVQGSSIIAPDVHDVYVPNISSGSDAVILPNTSNVSSTVAPIDASQSTKNAEIDLLFGNNFREPIIRLGLGLDFLSSSIYGKLFRIMQYLIEFLILFGIIKWLLSKWRISRFPEYSALTLSTGSLVIMYIGFPVASAYMGATRFYITMLILLLPLLVFGLYHLIYYKRSVIVTGVIIIGLYFMFTSGFVFETIKSTSTDTLELPYSISMSNYRMDIGGVFNSEDAESAIFLKNTINMSDVYYTDFYSTMITSDFMDWKRVEDMHYVMLLFPVSMSDIPDNAYIYLRKRNIDNRELSYYAGYGLRAVLSWDQVGLDKVLEGRSIIFDNGSRVYGPKRG